MPTPSVRRDRCPLCRLLSAAETYEREVDWCPAEAGQLERLGPVDSYTDSGHLRRCPHCSTLYGYRYRYEYLVGGSEEERELWRLPTAAQRVLKPTLLAEGADRDARIGRALGHPEPDVREWAAATLYGDVASGLPVDAALRPACEALAGHAFRAANWCYRGLLALVHRDPASAAAVRDALVAGGVPERDEQFSWILLRDVEKRIAGTDA